MKKIILKGKVFFTNREGATPSSMMFEPNREYIVEDRIAAHPVFSDRIAKIEDVKTEPKPEAKPVQKRTTRRRKNGSDSSCKDKQTPPA
mgnify:CR=1 FL=1